MNNPTNRTGGKVAPKLAKARVSSWLESVKKTTGIDPRTHEHGAVVLLLDCSDSMAADNRMGSAKDGALRFNREMIATGYEVGLIVFASNAELVCAPTRVGIENYLENVRCAGSTNLAAALRLALTTISKVPRSRKVIVVATDGYPDDADAALSAAAAAKAEGVEILVVGTEDADSVFLGKLASSKGGSIVVAPSRIGSGIAEISKLLPRS